MKQRKKLPPPGAGPLTEFDWNFDGVPPGYPEPEELVTGDCIRAQSVTGEFPQK